MKTLTLLTLLLLSHLSIAAASELVVTCRPSDYTSTIFNEITVSPLPGAAHAVTHIRAEGIYMAVDLLCSLDQCTGFMNGLKTTGSTVTEDGVLKSVKIKRLYSQDHEVFFNFTCL